MQTSNEFVHAPLAKLDYGFDWSLWLDTGETVATSSWAVSGLTSSDASNTGTVTAVFVEGGVVGQTYSLTNNIVTSVGRKDSRTIKLICKTR